jgi:hypothetical protein
MIFRYIRRLFRDGGMTKPERHVDTVLDESGSEVPKAAIHEATVVKEARYSVGPDEEVFEMTLKK